MRFLMRVSLVIAAAIAAAAASAQPATTCAPRHTTTALSTRPDAQQAMVPRGATSLRLCRYSGLNDGPPRIHLLANRLVTDRAAVADLASRVNALPPASGVYSCPADDGSAIVAEFRYPSGAPDPVTVGLTGCSLATNGHRTALAAGPARRLTALVPLPPHRPASRSCERRRHRRARRPPTPVGKPCSRRA